MKKQLFIISIVVIIVSIFVSCSAKNGNEDLFTTAVTDSKGTTHYYEPVTDDKGSISTTAKDQGVFAEIETDESNQAVTEKDGTYVTNEHTTVLPIKSTTDKASTKKKTTAKASSGTTKDSEEADNNVDFKPDKTTQAKPDTTATTAKTTTEKETVATTTTTTEKSTTAQTTTETTTKKETPPATDEDGWITKWY